jgi:hypothetical protein
LAIAAGSASAQVIRQIETDNTAYGTTAAEFLLLPATARGAALGGSFAALTTDVSSIYFNPAGLSQMSRPSVIASSMTYVADTKYNYVAFGLPNSGGSKAFGLSFASFGFSDAPVYTVEDPQGTSGEVYSVSQTVMGLTYSQQFSDRFSAGLTGKFINDRLGDVVGHAFAVDFGASFHANVGGRPVRAAFVIQNLGTTLSHDGQALAVTVRRAAPLDQQEVAQENAAASLQSKDWGLPVTFRVALSYDLFATTASRFSLLGEFTQPTNSDPGFNVAGEYNLGLGRSGFSIAGRGGFTYAPDNNLDPAASGSANYAGFTSSLSKDGSDGLSAGGGLHYQSRTFGIGFDYAYRNLGFLGSVNMLSVAFNW